MIRHLRHGDIDKDWWDNTLMACPNRLWYALAHVLDAASPGWEALVDDATGSIMPLTAKRKGGFSYLHQPFAVQQLGVFAREPSPELTGTFLSAVPDRFRLWDITLNNPESTGHPADVVLRHRVDMVLRTEGGLDALRSGYGESHRRGLRKHASEGGGEGMDAEDFLRFVLASEQVRQWRAGPVELRTLQRLVRMAAERGEGRALGVRHRGAWAAGGFFVRWNGRTIFLKGLATAEGRPVFAMHRLMDSAIAETAGTAGVFDLAGGEDAGLRRFYAGFGARPELYLGAFANRLPRPLRWLKQRSDDA